MEKAGIQEIERKTIGDVKAPLDVWSGVTTYKTQQKARHGRTLTMPEAMVELTRKQLEAQGLI
jgi:hypothetical protein